MAQKSDETIEIGAKGGSATSRKKTRANRIKARVYWDRVRSGEVKAPRKGKRLSYRKKVLKLAPGSECVRTLGEFYVFASRGSRISRGATPALAWKNAYLSLTPNER